MYDTIAPLPVERPSVAIVIQLLPSFEVCT
jgi:hypothetical protein